MKLINIANHSPSLESKPKRSCVCSLSILTILVISSTSTQYLSFPCFELFRHLSEKTSLSLAMWMDLQELGSKKSGSEKVILSWPSLFKFLECPTYFRFLWVNSSFDRAPWVASTITWLTVEIFHYASVYV